MATILWTTAQYSDRPVELSETQLVITQANCVGRDNSARALLRGTGDAPLIEGNTWGDTFWGVYLHV